MRILKILSLATFGFLGGAPLSVQAANEAAAENVQPQVQLPKGTLIIRAPLNERGQMNTDLAEMRYSPIRISRNIHPQQLMQIWAQGQQLQYQPNAARPEANQVTGDEQGQPERWGGRWGGGGWGGRWGGGGWGGRWGGWGGRWGGWGGRWGGWGGWGWRNPYFYGGYNPYYYGGYGYYGYSPYYYYPYTGYGYYIYY